MKIVKLKGDGWEADIICSSYGNIKSIEAKITGDSKDLAKSGADWIMDMFGKGRHYLIRCEPEADTYKDFDTKIEHHKGYVRFWIIHLSGKSEHTANIPFGKSLA